MTSEQKDVTFLPFHKYVAHASDFIIINNRNGRWSSLLADATLRAKLCDRRLGIGSDGLMAITTHSTAAYHVDHYLPNGQEAGVCGNGSRCTIAWARANGILQPTNMMINLFDGQHSVSYDDEGDVFTMGIRDISDVSTFPDGDVILDSGCPQHIRFVSDVEAVDISELAQTLQSSDERHTSRKPEVICVSVVQPIDAGTIRLRTYECEEILSCGTGSVAAAVAWSLRHQPELPQGEEKKEETAVEQRGGGFLKVSFIRIEQTFRDISLSGSASHVFDGEYMIS